MNIYLFYKNKELLCADMTVYENALNNINQKYKIGAVYYRSYTLMLPLLYNKSVTIILKNDF